MNESKLPDRVLRMFAAACDGRLDDAERAELESLLMADEAARVAFVDFCQMHSDLHFQIRAGRAGRRAIAGAVQNLAATLAADLELHPARPTPLNDGLARTRGRRWFGASHVGPAALVAALVLLVATWRYVGDRTPDDVRAQRDPQPVASLVGGVGAKWQGERAPAVGGTLVEGQVLQLGGGEARVSMACGADLALRGECSLVIGAEDRVSLHHGALSFQAAEWTHGFTVATRAAEVVDLGAQFTVIADIDGSAEAHVYAGQVRVQPMEGDVNQRRSVLLSAGEAIRIESLRQTATRMVADPTLFALQGTNFRPFRPIEVFNTGHGLQVGDEDPHWRIIGGPLADVQAPGFAVVCDAHRRYLVNDATTSQWLSVTRAPLPGCILNSTFTFETTFDLSGYEMESVTIVAHVMADNGLSGVRVNGKPILLEPWTLNARGQAFNRFRKVQISDGLAPGVNVVQFDVWNGVDNHSEEERNPMALRVEWQAYGRPAVDDREDADDGKLAAAAPRTIDEGGRQVCATWDGVFRPGARMSLSSGQL